MGKALGLNEDYLFWSMVKKLSAGYGYRIITLTENHQEIWLENTHEKKHPVIRLMRHDLDWASWLNRDIERTSLNGEKIRQKLYKKPLEVLNIYVTSFAPVDDYEFTRKPTINNKTTIHTFILETDAFNERMEELQQILSKSLSIELPGSGEVQAEEIDEIKQSALAESVKMAKQEQQLFQQGKPFFTYILMAIQIAVFIIMEFSGGSTNTKTLIDFGAKYTPLMLQGEWWRFFAPMVIHIGFFHLAMNTLSLYFIGAEVERIFGRTRFLLLYVFAGFAGVLASFIMSPTVSAGASGAVFGCFGALLYFGLSHPKLFMRTMGMNVIVLIVINLGYGFSVGNVDNAGHIGGLIGGFLASGVLNLPKSKQLVKQLVFAVVTVGLTFFLLHYGFSQPKASESNDQIMTVVAADYEEKGEIEKAKQMLSAYTEDFSEAPYSYFYLATIEAKAGNLEQAEVYNVKAIEQKPDFPDAHYYLAVIYLEQNKLELGLEQAEKAAELNPEDKRYQELIEKIKGL